MTDDLERLRQQNASDYHNDIAPPYALVAAMLDVIAAADALDAEFALFQSPTINFYIAWHAYRHARAQLAAILK